MSEKQDREEMDFSKYNVILPYGDYTDALQEELERIDKLSLTQDEYNHLKKLAPQVAAQKIYNQAQEEMRKLFEQDMEEEFGFSYLPNEVKERVHGAAWENGYYGDVYAHYPDIVDLVESVWVEDKDGKDVYVRPANCGNRA